MTTTIAINDSTRETLKRCGRKGETYDDIILNLIEIAKYHNFLEQQKWILKNESFSKVESL